MPQQTFILIHGIGASSTYLKPLQQALQSKGHHAVTIDLPGYGSSPYDGPALSIAELADWLAIEMKNQRLSHVTLVGHSMGAQVVSHVAQKYPHLLRSQILLGPVVNRKEKTVWLQFVRLLQDMTKEPHRLRMLLTKSYFAMGVRRYVATARMMIDDDIYTRLGNLSLPTLIMRGSGDPIAPQPWTKALADHSGASHEEIPGAAHALHYTHPEVVADTLVLFANKQTGDR